MARIVLLHHIDDNFFHFNRRFGLRRKQSVFMMKSVLDDLARRGHRIRYESDPDRVSGGDLLILHVNLSRVPAAFLAAAARFPASINAAVTDISKRSYSQLLVVADSDWDGPVIVKSNLNYHGLPEVWHNERASARGLDAPYPDVRPVMDYDIYPRLSEVPEPCWTDPMRVVEKFIPRWSKTALACAPISFAVRPSVAPCKLPLRESSRAKASFAVKWFPCRPSYANCATEWGSIMASSIL